MTTTAWIVRDDRPARATIDEAVAALGHAQLVWIHHHDPREDAEVARCLPHHVPAEALAALMAEETRPRTDIVNGNAGGGAIINLRGPGDLDPTTSDPLVSIRIWASPGQLVSVTFRRMTALGVIEAEMAAGRILDPGDFVAVVANAVASELDPEVAKIGDDLDDIESALEASTPLSERRMVGRIRSQAIRYRRFLGPQNAALARLATLAVDWIEEADRAKLREAADRAARMAEELESIRERAAVAHEELTDLRSEKLDSRSLQVAIVATVFLPLTFITGLLGMNVGGIPFAHDPAGFWIIVGLCLVLTLVLLGWLWRRHWIEQN